MKTTRPHVLVALGTRPEALKLAPVIRELMRQRKEFRFSVCATAQHRQLLDQVTKLFRIPVHHDLDLMIDNQTLPDLTARALVGFSAVVEEAKPDVIVVQGDTTTTFVAALAGFYQRVPVAHVEAGLRTHDRYAPFPEEINRRLTTQVCSFHFAPTSWARDNLLREGVPAESIYVTGNTVVDTFLEAQKLVRRRAPSVPGLRTVNWNRHKLILVTAHRRENFGEGIRGICHALREIVQRHQDVEIVYPVHPNPNVRRPVSALLGDIPRIHLLEPLAYLPFVWLMTQAYLVLTDSGGIQEEMPSLGRPVLVMREKTERPEGVNAGVCQLVGTRSESIVGAVTRLLSNEQAYRSFGDLKNPFGDGKAAARIVSHLYEALRNRPMAYKPSASLNSKLKNSLVFVPDPPSSAENLT